MSPAVVMAGSVPLVDGGEGGKTASDAADGRWALNSTKPVPPDAGQGGLRGRLTAPQPAGGGVTPAWAQHHPRGTRSCDKRRPEHSVGWRCWLAGEQGTHPDSQSRSLAGSRRRVGRGGARRCPGGAERRQAGRRHSARGPVSLGGRQQAAPCGDVVSSRAPPAGAAATYLPGGQPARCTCRSDPPRPASAPAGHTAALPSTRRLPRYPAALGRASSGWLVDRSPKTRSRFAIHTSGWRAQSYYSSEAHARAPRCTARSTRAGRCAGCWRLQRTHPDAGMLADGLRKLGSGRAPRRGAATATPSITHVSRPQPLRPL